MDAKIRRIHGRRVAELLHEVLERRAEEVRSALDGLRLHYRGYGDELERRFTRRKALRIEQRELAQLFDDGLIGPELQATLLARIAAERARLERRPALDPGLSKVDLVRWLPLFSDLDARAARRLARALVTAHADPGDVLMQRGEAVRSVTFIASGAVELDTAGVSLRLGPGEMFGQLTILGRRRRRTEARALTHCTLLRLDEARFQRLLAASATFRAAVEHGAVKRGLTLSPLTSGGGGTAA